MSNWELDLWAILYARSRCFILLSICGVTHGLCLLGIVNVMRGAIWSNVVDMASVRDFVSKSTECEVVG